MAVGTGATTIENIPSQPFVTDPATFFQLTSRNVNNFSTTATPGGGEFFTKALPQVGLISKLRITFVGTLTVATAAVTTSNQWPYNLLKALKVSVNGQNDLFSCDGLDLHALRDVRYPAWSEATDTFSGSVGGGDSIGVGATTLALTWEIPIAIDDVSLVGSLFAQSSSMNIVATCTQAANSDLFSANPANATIAGNWNIEETFFEVPYNDQGQLVLPDLSRLHGFNAVSVPFTATGDQKAFLVRSQGQLVRLFISADSDTNARLSALPSAAATKKIDTARFEYGGNQRPYVWNPASTLVGVNNQHYGAPVVYDRMVLDLLKENPARDVILMQGITEPAVVLGINSGVTVTSASIRLVQETLF